MAAGTWRYLFRLRGLLTRCLRGPLTPSLTPHAAVWGRGGVTDAAPVFFMRGGGRQKRTPAWAGVYRPRCRVVGSFGPAVGTFPGPAGATEIAALTRGSGPRRGSVSRELPCVLWELLSRGPGAQHHTKTYIRLLLLLLLLLLGILAYAPPRRKHSA